MSRKDKQIGWLVVALAVLAITAVALVQARTRAISKPAVTSELRIETSNSTAQSTQARTKSSGPRNLSLQPEAFNMGRRLGQRFSSSKREKSVLIGTLTIGSERRIVQTTRTQTDDGEQVEITIAGSQGSLTWDRGQGALSSSGRATGSDRELIERLVLDSPDQFVLAQLRGASYYTVVRNVRPDDANDGYAGPLWNIVRVGDPQTDNEKQPESRWRLYYINTTTGLIDRIVSEVQGQQITAELKWTEAGGETLPAQIVWTRQRRTIMQYNLSNFSHAEHEGGR